MKAKWMKNMIVPVLAMIFVYYATNLQVPDPINTVTSINGLTDVVNAEVSAETHHIVYGMHESNYLVRSAVEINPHVSWVHSVFDALTSEQNRLAESVSSLIPESAQLLNYEFDGSDLTLNLSREFLEYDSRWERQLLSSLVWSLTEGDQFDRVFFRIEGEPVTNLNSALNVGSGLTRAMGINLELETQSTNSQQVLLYFLAGTAGNQFLVPVTRVVSADVDPVTYAVNALSEGPRGQHYLSVVSHNANLVDEPLLQDGVLTLNFDNGLFFDQNHTQVSSVAVLQLVMTLTELYDVESVSILVDGSTHVFDNESRPISVPASRTFVDPFVSNQ